MAAIAARYGRDGTFWANHPRLPYMPVIDYEIWNEPNLGSFWGPRPDPAAYARTVEAASAAIRSADAGARIVLGGLAPFSDSQPATASTRAHLAAGEFLADVQAADPSVGGAFDVLGAHANGTPDVILDQLAEYRYTLDRLDLGSIPISLNETGWPTQGEGGFTNVPEPTRATYMREVGRDVALSGCGVESFAPHTWVTAETDPADQEDWFGLADPHTGQPYPSAVAYADDIRGLPGATPLTTSTGNCGG
jgi:hypothetical protein